MRKLCSLMITLIILTVSSVNVFAQDTNIITQANTVYTLSLKDAIDKAFTDNERIIANEYKQYSDEINITNAYLTRKPYKDTAVNVSSNFELYCLKEGYYIETAKMAQRLTKLEEEKIRASISYEVTNSYYNLVLMRKLVNAADNAYKLALTNKKIVDEQFNMGLIPQLDYENAVLSVDAAKASLDAYMLNEKIAEDNLKIVLNINDESTSLVLTDDIEIEEYTSNVSEDIKSSLTTRYDINALRENRDLAYMYFDLAEVLTKGSATYNTAYSSYLDAEYNYNSTVKLIGLSIKTSYNNILTSKQSMDIASRQYYMKLRQYEAAKIKYDLGAIANVELTSSINELYDAQVSYANAKLSYRMAIEKYKVEIITGL